MKSKKNRNIALEIVVITGSMLGLMMLLYFVMIVSFQNGTVSSDVTSKLAGQIARRIFTDPTKDQIRTTELMIRYGAHLSLFFVVGLVTTFVSMVIFRGFYRIIGVIGAGAVCYLLILAVGLLMSEALALGGQALVELAGCLCGGALAGVLSGGRKKKRSAARKK